MTYLLQVRLIFTVLLALVFGTALWDKGQQRSVLPSTTYKDYR